MSKSLTDLINHKQYPATMQELFKMVHCIRIPEYQRAYSWENLQCIQFLDDLIEQLGKRYYLGQFLFEKHNDTLYLIDGQQRITTTILLLSAIAKVKQEKKLDISTIKIVYLTDIFRTISDDHLIFKQLTQKHKIADKDETDTLSQRRLISAFCYFEERLKLLSDEILEGVQQTLEKAMINTFYISSKVEATQIFEYQNNRGKDLSKFEVIKAYLMHQVYLRSNDIKYANSIIDDIQNTIGSIYRYIEYVEGYFTESELLDYCCILNYNMDGGMDAFKKRVNESDNKVEWIKEFFENFASLARSARSIVKNKSRKEIANLFLIGNSAKWQLIVIALYS